jgi:ribosomal subunit interface protein
MIDIQARNFTLTDAIDSHIREKLEHMVHNNGDKIQKIIVHLSDDNGPKGGIDKRCHIHVDMKKLPTVVIEDSEENLYTAIDNAYHRAERAVRKSIEKVQTKARNVDKTAINEV